jgi:hypothetical protein
MQPDEVRIHDAREWIARSREDLDMAAFAPTPKPCGSLELKASDVEALR